MDDSNIYEEVITAPPALPSFTLGRTSSSVILGLAAYGALSLTNRTVKATKKFVEKRKAEKPSDETVASTTAPQQ